MLWAELAATVGGEPDHSLSAREVAAVVYDSRAAVPGAVFVAIPGQHHDGHDHVVEALTAGALAAVVERRVSGAPPAAQLVVPDSRRALARLAAAFYSHPSEHLQVVGITGTDGKTTTTTMLHSALQASLGKTGALTTVDFRIGDVVEPNLTRQTTLESADIQRQLRRMVDSGCVAAAIEATSHGLALGRLDSVHFGGAVYTTISHEHLDFHKTWEAYFEAKATLVDRVREADGFAVLNLDDVRAYPRLLARAPERRLTYSAQGSAQADLRALSVTPEPAGVHFTASTPVGPCDVRLGMHGRWNLANALAALATGISLHQDLAALVDGLERLKSVPGRMETVDLGQPFSVIVDYAHTPAALQLALHELRTATPGRLWAVFGSAGERDVAKRAEMGRIAAGLADQMVLTDEDCRSEDPERIIDQIAQGAREYGALDGESLHRQPDRALAIRFAIERAQPGDTVLLAGKGHERSIIGPQGSQPWDERAAAEEALRSRY